jgi:hypothetical protein
MALTVSLDAGLMGNPTVETAKSRGMAMYVGRLVGTYGGALTTMTIPIGMPLFVSIPPVSNYAFHYNVGTSMFAVMVQGASASNSVLATSPTSIDLASFASYWNGTVSCGLPFVAFGWG